MTTPSPAAMRAAKAIDEAQLVSRNEKVWTGMRYETTPGAIDRIARIIDAEMGTAKVVEATEAATKTAECPDTDWQRRAVVAEAEVKAARDCISKYLSANTIGAHAQGFDSGLRVVRDEMNAAREEAGRA